MTDAEPTAAAGPFSEALRVAEGFQLSDTDPRATPLFDGKKKKGKKAIKSVQQEISRLQERLFADGKSGSRRSVLLVVQGMDTAGKGGIMRHVISAIDPQGVRYHAFKAPTPEELGHDFLWRIEREVPATGLIGVFDRSQYEDVLIVRVHNLVPEEQWQARYDQINDWEERLSASGTTIVKVMLNISNEEQRARLAERLNRADKYWKYNPGDIDERALWPKYQEAYQAALTRCSTAHAPWYVVPADRKWYARLAVSHLMMEALGRIDPQWPGAEFDIEAEKARLAAT